MSTVARARSTDKRYYGVAEGLVTNLNDPGHEGRVQVKFPWFDDQMVSEWCRVSHFYAGSKYGAFFVPEVGTEVLVAFIHGDMRLPVIIGGLYNGKDKPPSYRDGDTKNQKMLRTSGGHELLFDDSQNNQCIQCKTSGGHVVTMDDTGKPNTVSVSIKTSGGHKVELDDVKGKVTVTSSTGGVIMLENGTITLQGATVNIEAAAINLGGTSAVEQLMLGTSFMTIFNTHQHALSIPSMSTVGPPIPPMTPANLSKTSKAL